LEGFRHDRGRADALEAVVGAAAAGHLLDDLEIDRSISVIMKNYYLRLKI
jgi:hypothetical protein